MSYSYECNVICDGCKAQISTGTTERTAEESKEAAIKEAESNDWVFENNRWLCYECAFSTKP